MKEILNLELQNLLLQLKLEKALMEYSNDYVFGWDDVQRVILSAIEKTQS